MKVSMKKHQSGISLIEIMIALTIGLFLLAGLYQIFISTKQSYRLADAQSRLQENARYALELLNHDIRLAGYFGCSGVSATNPIVVANEPLIAPHAHPGNGSVVAASIVTGGNNNASGSFSAGPALTVSPLTPLVWTTDAITVQFGESCGGFTTAPLSTVNPTAAAIPATNTCGTIRNGTGTTSSTLGTPLVISNCDSAHIFRASAGTTQNKDAGTGVTSALGATYPAGSEIMLYRSYTYFIRENPAGQPSLYRLDNNDASSVAAVEMVEGIEDMQITYGVDSDANDLPNQYVASPADWTQVISVRVVLTVRSIEDNLTTAVRSYTYNGSAENDRRLVRTFATTIGLRNR
jgi:type IV pilus assembly protein PilW